LYTFPLWKIYFMANEHGTDIEYRVYKIVGKGEVGQYERFNGLVWVGDHESFEEAQIWIENEGARHVDYTILQIFKNK